jgi:hypothetical protein
MDMNLKKKDGYKVQKKGFDDDDGECTKIYFNKQPTYV